MSTKQTTRLSSLLIAVTALMVVPSLIFLPTIGRPDAIQGVTAAVSSSPAIAHPTNGPSSLATRYWPQPPLTG